MEIAVPVGSYVVAVSGGVDSVVLLDLLAKQGQRAKGKEQKSENTALNPQPSALLVAHFDHGMREDSKTDRQFVQELAHHYRLPFVYDMGALGAGTSEAKARQARYDFLHRVRAAAAARAIITAHHQDDVLETAIINLLRGTGRKGLTSLKSTDTLVRPLLHIPKQDLIDYAKTNNLTWREDSTNQNTIYLRNHVRHNILPRFKPEHRQQLLDTISHMHDINDQIDGHLINQLHVQPAKHTLDRHWFIMLPHFIASEALATWLRHSGVRSFDKKLLERLIIAAKTYHPDRQIDINKGYILTVSKEQLALSPRER